MTILSLKKNLTFFTALTGTVIGTMHVVNRIFQYISTADNMLSDDKYDYYNWRFGKITYKKTGSGSPVLLIHDLNVLLPTNLKKSVPNYQRQILYIR